MSNKLIFAESVTIFLSQLATHVFGEHDAARSQEYAA
jgi:hypothetical protein